MAIVPFAPQSYDEFPESRETCEGMRSLAMDKSAIGVDFHLDVPYAERDGRTLHLQIFVPVRHGDGPDARYPLVVYVQKYSSMRTEMPQPLQQVERQLPPLQRKDG